MRGSSSSFSEVVLTTDDVSFSPCDSSSSSDGATVITEFKRVTKSSYKQLEQWCSPPL